MKPGRELDALVAEKVMGFEVKTETRPYELSDLNLHPGDRYIGDGKQIPPYSTEIGAAWTIVDKGLIESLVRLRDGRWFARPCQKEFNLDTEKDVLKVGWDMGPHGMYYEIPIYEKDHDECGAFGVSAPHAICLAALKLTENP